VYALGDFADEALARRLTGHLPGDNALQIRPRFEWYACRGAGFHTDAHYTGVLFGAWCLSGPARDVLFPRGALRAPAAVGDLVVFDPFEPHAVLEAGQLQYDRDLYTNAEPSVFLGFEVLLDAAACAHFGVGPEPSNGERLASDVPINAESGRIG